MSDCIFCKIISGEIPSTPVFQNENVIVINDIHPQAPVHLLVIPKKHTTDITEMDSTEFQIYMKEVRESIIREKVIKFRTVHNGKGAQYVPHAHTHIMGSIDVSRNL